MISVITPVLNAASTLARCLAGDDQGVEYQRIYIDGGSTDGSREIIGSSVIDLPGSCIYEAMNHGIDLALYDWLYFIGADDYLIPGALKALQPELEKAQVPLLQGMIKLDFRVPRHNRRQQSYVFHKSLFEGKKFKTRSGWFSDVEFVNSVPKTSQCRIDVAMAYVAMGGVSSRV